MRDPDSLRDPRSDRDGPVDSRRDDPVHALGLREPLDAALVLGRDDRPPVGEGESRRSRIPVERDHLQVPGPSRLEQTGCADRRPERGDVSAGPCVAQLPPPPDDIVATERDGASLRRDLWPEVDTLSGRKVLCDAWNLSKHASRSPSCVAARSSTASWRCCAVGRGTGSSSFGSSDGRSRERGDDLPAATRLRKEQLVTTFWRESESGLPRRYYEPPTRPRGAETSRRNGPGSATRSMRS